MELTASELREYEHFAHDLADAARAVTLPKFRRATPVINKAVKEGFDPVTEADKEAERVMRDLIQGAYPEHGIIGEEFDNLRDERTEGTKLDWVLDPIDGTRSYICGIPLWGTLIALCLDGVPKLGMMSQPYTGERYYGNGSRAELLDSTGSTLLKTRPCPKLTEATLCATHPELFDTADSKMRFERVSAAARLTRFGGDCYLYCMLALGQIDLVIESGLQFYDIAALIPIIEGAGGVVTNWSGERNFDNGRVIAAGDRQLHDSALKLLNA